MRTLGLVPNCTMCCFIIQCFLPCIRSSLEMQIKAVYSVHRAVEDSNFTYHIGNKQLLYHSSNVS